MRPAVVFAIALALAPPATAHGPCGGCLSVSSGPPGDEVRITNTTAYWVVWNGRGLPQDQLLRPHYRSDAPTIDLVNLAPRGLPPLESVAPSVIPQARRGVEFRIPQVPHGRYPVVIYDGSEAGEHYTWELFTVTGPQERSSRWTVAALAAAGAALVAAVLYGARRSNAGPPQAREGHEPHSTNRT